MGASTATAYAIPPRQIPSNRPRRRPRVAGRVSDISMPQVVLNQARIESLVCQREATRVSEHVGVDVEGQAGALADLQRDS